MNCKKCGKQLRTNARFCDYCGQAVRTETTQRRTSGTQTRQSSTSRTASSSRTAAARNYEKQKARKRELERRKKQKTRQIITFLILASIVLAVVLAFAVNNMFTKNSDSSLNPTPTPGVTDGTLTDDNSGDNDTTDENNSSSSEEDDTPTSKSTASPKPTSKTSAKSTSNDDEEEDETKSLSDYKAVSDNCKLYRDNKMKNIRCPYPENFEQGSVSNENTVISFVDLLNDGSMMISAADVGSSASAKTLLKEYADGVGGSISSSRAGDGWYSITFERNNKVNHRKAVLSGGSLIYYDFSYDVDSAEKSSYDEYIEYIDFYLDSELSKVQASEKPTDE